MKLKTQQTTDWGSDESLTHKQLQFLTTTMQMRPSVVQALTKQQADTLISRYCKEPPATAKQLQYAKHLGAQTTELKAISKSECDVLIKRLLSGEHDGRSF